MTDQATDNHPPKRPSQRVRLLLATGAILILLPCLGLVGSSVYLQARQAGTFSRWRSLGAPPGSGVDIVAGTTKVVWVRSSTGQIYICRHRATRWAQDCWDEAEELVPVEPIARSDMSVFEGNLEPPAGTVVDTLEVSLWYAEDAFETRYVLLDDGTVWKWEYDRGAYWSLLILILGPVGGLALGIGAAAAMWTPVALHAVRRRRRRPNSQ